MPLIPSELIRHELKRLQIAAREKQNAEGLHPSEVGAEHYHVAQLPQATQPAQYVRFQCLACGGVHDDLGALMDCHTNKQRACASAPILQAA